MALQKKHVVTIYGRELVFEAAYAKITKVNGNKDEVTIEVVTFSESTKEHVIEGYQIFKFVPSQNEDGERWDKQGYEHLKTLPEFAEAIDV